MKIRCLMHNVNSALEDYVDDPKQSIHYKKNNVIAYLLTEFHGHSTTLIIDEEKKDIRNIGDEYFVKVDSIETLKDIQIKIENLRRNFVSEINGLLEQRKSIIGLFYDKFIPSLQDISTAIEDDKDNFSKK